MLTYLPKFTSSKHDFDEIYYKIGKFWKAHFFRKIKLMIAPFPNFNPIVHKALLLFTYMSFCLVDIKDLGDRNLACLFFNTWIQNFQEYRKFRLNEIHECFISCFCDHHLKIMHKKIHYNNRACEFPWSSVSKTFMMIHQLWSNRYIKWNWFTISVSEFCFSTWVDKPLIQRKPNVFHMKNSLLLFL